MSLSESVKIGEETCPMLSSTRDNLSSWRDRFLEIMRPSGAEILLSDEKMVYVQLLPQSEIDKLDGESKEVHALLAARNKQAYLKWSDQSNNIIPAFHIGGFSGKSPGTQWFDLDALDRKWSGILRRTLSDKPRRDVAKEQGLKQIWDALDADFSSTGNVLKRLYSLGKEKDEPLLDMLRSFRECYTQLLHAQVPLGDGEMVDLLVNALDGREDYKTHCELWSVTPPPTEFIRTIETLEKAERKKQGKRTEGAFTAAAAATAATAGTSPATAAAAGATAATVPTADVLPTSTVAAAAIPTAVSAAATVSPAVSTTAALSASAATVPTTALATAAVPTAVPATTTSAVSSAEGRAAVP